MPNRAAFCAPAPRLYLKLRVQGKKLLRQPAQQEYPRSLSTLSDV